VAREVQEVVEWKSAQHAAARVEPVVQERESRQRAAAGRREEDNDQ
jgi:hypothetical protein